MKDLEMKEQNLKLHEAIILIAVKAKGLVLLPALCTY